MNLNFWKAEANFYQEGRGAFRLIGAVWCATAIVLMNAYSGKLISSVTKPSVKHYPQHEAELVNENFPLEYAVLDNSLGAELIKVHHEICRNEMIKLQHFGTECTLWNDENVGRSSETQVHCSWPTVGLQISRFRMLCLQWRTNLEITHQVDVLNLHSSCCRISKVLPAKITKRPASVASVWDE